MSKSQSNQLKGYELLIIIKPHLSDEVYKGHMETITSLITKNDGETTYVDAMGIRDLATEFNKFQKGYYAQFQFKGTNATLDNLQEKIRLNEDIIRHMIVDIKDVKDLSQPQTEEEPA